MESLNFLPSVIAETIWDYVVPFPRCCLLAIRRTQEGIEVVMVNQGDEARFEAVSEVLKLPVGRQVKRVVFCGGKLWVHCVEFIEEVKTDIWSGNKTVTQKQRNSLFSWSQQQGWNRQWGLQNASEIYAGDEYLGVYNSKAKLRRLPLGSELETSVELVSHSKLFGGFGGMPGLQGSYAVCFGNQRDWEIRSTPASGFFSGGVGARVSCSGHSIKRKNPKILHHTAEVHPAAEILSTQILGEKVFAVLTNPANPAYSTSLSLILWDIGKVREPPSRLTLNFQSRFEMSSNASPEFIADGNYAQLRAQGRVAGEAKWGCFDLWINTGSGEMEAGEMRVTDFDKDLHHFVLVPKDWSGTFSHV